MSEAIVLKEVMLEASRLGAKVWRNNTGGLYDQRGRFVRYGLCVGSSDLIGIYRGRFLAIEVKDKGGRATAEQLNFIRVIKEQGGIAFVCDDAKNLKNMLDAFLD